jgi:hypothetical protein
VLPTSLPNCQEKGLEEIWRPFGAGLELGLGGWTWAREGAAGKICVWQHFNIYHTKLPLGACWLNLQPHASLIPSLGLSLDLNTPLWGSHERRRNIRKHCRAAVRSTGSGGIFLSLGFLICEMGPSHQAHPSTNANLCRQDLVLHWHSTNVAKQKWANDMESGCCQPCSCEHSAPSPLPGHM